MIWCAGLLAVLPGSPPSFLTLPSPSNVMILRCASARLPTSYHPRHPHLFSSLPPSSARPSSLLPRPPPPHPAAAGESSRSTLRHYGKTQLAGGTEIGVPARGVSSRGNDGGNESREAGSGRAGGAGEGRGRGKGVRQRAEPARPPARVS
jgi:hypothetical protein